MKQFIIGQDRDIICEKGDLNTFPQIINGVLFGINLFCGETFLGTFDSVQEAVREMERISASTDEYILVDGYMGDEADAELMKLLDELNIHDIAPDELFDLLTEALND